MDARSLEEKVADAKFDEFDKSKGNPIHDWRAYIPDTVRAVWNEIPMVAKVCVIQTGEKAAVCAEWAVPELQK